MRTVTALILVAGLTAAAAAAEIHVRPDGQGDVPTIQAALDVAQPGDVVVLSDGVFTGDGNRDLDTGGKALTVRAAGADPAACVLDAQGQPGAPHRLFVFDSGEGADTVVEGVTLTGAHAGPSGGAVRCTGGAAPTFAGCRFVANTATENGGALYCNGSDPVLRDCVFEDNTAHYYGGAVRCIEASPRFERCEFRGGDVLSGPGICFYRDCEPVLVDCVFEDNTGQRGGGIYAYASRCALVRCRFTGNAVLAEGGAIIAAESDLVLEDCRFEANTAGEYGGAIFSGQGSLQAVGCVFVGNASPRGGGVHAQYATVALESCTLARNEATVIGSGVSLLTSSVRLARVIVAFGAGTAAVECADPDSVPRAICTDIHGNAGGDWTGCLAGQAGVAGNLDADPLFCDLAAGDLTLSADSPCAPAGQPGCGLVGALPVGCGDVTGSGPPPAAGLALHAWPNPFNPAVTVRFALPAPGPVALHVLDVAGRRVRILASGRLPAGMHTVVWDGRDDHGRPVASGPYLLRLGHARGWETVRIALVR